MSTPSTVWAFPPDMQPQREHLRFDLDVALDAMVLLTAHIPEEAYTAPMLGTERNGYGCVIGDDGLVLTIGYLVTEAQTVWLTNARGQVVPGHVLGVDFTSGLALILPTMALRAKPLARGRSGDVALGDAVCVLGHGGSEHALASRLTAREPFAGYWEYVLDEALFTAPAHPQWGGAAVVDADGRLIGVGSLMVQQQLRGMSDGGVAQGDDHGTRMNMSVPVDLLEPVLNDLLRHGRAQRPARPWLGFYVQQHEGHLVVAGLAPRGPAARAGLEPGDVIEAVSGQRIGSDLAELFRAIWALGDAGVKVPLTVRRDVDHHDVVAESVDRDSILWRPRGLN